MKNNIKQRLDELGLKQKDLAKRINSTEVSISRYISGKRISTVDVAIMMAKALNCTVEYLFYYDATNYETN